MYERIHARAPPQKKKNVKCEIGCRGEISSLAQTRLDITPLDGRHSRRDFTLRQPSGSISPTVLGRMSNEQLPAYICAEKKEKEKKKPPRPRPE